MLENLNIGIVAGLLLQLIGKAMGFFWGNNAGIIGYGVILAGLVVLLWGCMRLCVEKGYSKWFGLLGLFSCIGVFILLAFPDKQ